MKKIAMKLTTVTTILGALVFCSWTLRDDKNDDFLSKEMIEIEHLIQFKDSLNAVISRVDVAWHLDHILITINEVYKEMAKSNPDAYKGNFSFGRAMMFIFNSIPRGKATSPEIVKPPEAISLQEIQAQLMMAKVHLVKFDSLPKKAHFKHPYIGVCKRKHAKKFLKIHTNHHLEIIHDILNK